MRTRTAFWGWLGLITLAWLAVAPPELGIWPLVDAEGAASGWWRLRQHTLYLSGLWSMGLMSLIMLLALRLPLLEQALGGMDQVYRLHKWAGMGAGITAIVHWAAKEGGGFIAEAFGRAGRPPREAVLAWLADGRDLAKDLGEWAFYLLLAMIALTVLQRLLSYRRWRVLHRAMPLLYLALVFHTLALTPISLWALPLGMLQALLLGLGTLAALWSLAGWIGLRRRHLARIHAVQRLGEGADAPLEVLCALPASWPGHRAGQFVFARFHRREGHHPFTIASAPGSLGQTAQGQALLRLVIKPLGDYTRSLHEKLRVGQAVQIEGPYGRFDARGSRARTQVWVAGGVGVTPFLALLEARQGGLSAPPTDAVDATAMHYCTRDAAHDPLLPRLRRLCEQAHPPVRLTVHDQARGERLRPQDLQTLPGPLDIWFCGPQGLGDALDAHPASGWHVHRESFAMR